MNNHLNDFENQAGRSGFTQADAYNTNAKLAPPKRTRRTRAQLAEVRAAEQLERVKEIAALQAAHEYFNRPAGDQTVSFKIAHRLIGVELARCLAELGR